MPSWRLILAGIVLSSAIGFHLYERNRAYNEGARAVRLEWAEATRRAELKAEAKRKADEAIIRANELASLAREQMSRAQINDLQAALEAERLDDAQSNNPACPPAMSRRLSNAVGRVGR